MTTNGGELVARTLAAAGVRHAFGIHGGHLDSMLTEMIRQNITLVDTRHEAAGGNAAEAYARVTGGLGVAFATAGPGSPTSTHQLPTRTPTASRYWCSRARRRSERSSSTSCRGQ